LNMDSEQERLLRETHRLALENNKLLRSMRRQAWMSRIITLLIYAALIALPIWFYFAYVSDTVNQLLEAYGVMEARGQDAAGQYQNFADMLREFQNRMTDGGGAPASQ